MAKKTGIGRNIGIGATAIVMGVAALPIFAPDMPIAGKFTPNYAVNIAADTARAFFDPSVPKILNMGSYTCSGYAVRAAEIVNPDAEFVQADAWELPSSGVNQPIWEGEASSLEDLVAQLKESGEELKEGDIIGMYNSGSSFNEEGRPYTHAVTYVGEGDIIHQYGLPVLKSDLNEFMGYAARSDKALGNEGEVLIKAVIRADHGDNNDFYLRDIISGSGFYMTVPEIDKN